MKKLIPLLLAIGLIASSLCFAVSADALSDGEVNAVWAEKAPTIDGQIDEMWEYADEVMAVKFGSNIYPDTSTEFADETDPVAYARVRFMWDSTHIYALARVFDTTPNESASKKNPEDCDIDSVDFQISEMNGDDEAMRDDTVGAGNKFPGNGIFNVNINGKVTGWGGVWYADKGSEKVQGAAAKTEYGYVIEIAIPLQTVTVDKGDTIGMEIQINDNQNGTGRTAIRQWSCDECLGHSNTKYLGKVTMAGASDVKNPFSNETEPKPAETNPPATVAETKKPKPAETTPVTAAEGTEGSTETSAPVTENGNSLPAIIGVCAAVIIIAVVVFIVVKKKRQSNNAD